MSDVFLSYARGNAESAEVLARALERAGFSVWWDRKILAGKSYDQVIRQALAEAGCVIVLWSKESVDSDWVKDEAAEGKERGVLVPVLIDPVEIPLGFGRLQTARLIGWEGEAAHPDFQQLAHSITAMLGRTAEIKPFHPTAKKKQKKKSLSKGVLVGCGVAAALGLALVIGLAMLSAMMGSDEPKSETLPFGTTSLPPESLPPPTSATSTTIYLQYTGDSFGGCSLNLRWMIGNSGINPTLNPQPVPGVPIGQIQFQVDGTIQCPYSGFCNAAGSGMITVEPNATYNILWQQTGPATCGANLQRAF